MKTRKNTTQKSVSVNKDFYTTNQIKAMLITREVFYFDAVSYKVSRRDQYNFDDIDIRIWLEDTKEIKVIYDEECECYTTIAITNRDKKVYITL